MNRIAAAAAAVLLALPALAASAPATETTAPAKKGVATQTFRGKAQAPVQVTTRLRTDGATVTVRVLSAATGVTIEARGLDGLTVTSAANVLSGGRFARGESLRFDVTFAKEPGRSQLVVSVSGRFGPATRSAVASFPIGQASAAQQKPSESATTDSTGQRLKILPAEAR
jgi:hypothetical protein